MFPVIPYEFIYLTKLSLCSRQSMHNKRIRACEVFLQTYVYTKIYGFTRCKKITVNMF